MFANWVNVFIFSIISTELFGDKSLYCFHLLAFSNNGKIIMSMSMQMTLYITIYVSILIYVLYPVALINIIIIIFWDAVSLCHPGRSAMEGFQFTAISTAWVQTILPQPSE